MNQDLQARVAACLLEIGTLEERNDNEGVALHSLFRCRLILEPLAERPRHQPALQLELAECLTKMGVPLRASREQPRSPGGPARGPRNPSEAARAIARRSRRSASPGGNIERAGLRVSQDQRPTRGTPGVSGRPANLSAPARKRQFRVQAGKGARTPRPKRRRHRHDPGRAKPSEPGPAIVRAVAKAPRRRSSMPTRPSPAFRPISRQATGESQPFSTPSIATARRSLRSRRQSRSSRGLFNQIPIRLGTTAS